MSDQAKDVSVDGRVLAFGMIALLVMIVLICTTLILFLASAQSKLADAESRLLEQTNMINTVQRSMDRAEGRLGVYEDFLIGTQAGPVRRTIRKYLLSEKVRSDVATVIQFEQWLYTKAGGGPPIMPTTELGIGGQ